MNLPNFIFLLSTIFFQFFSAAYSIGVNYGTLGDNLPPPAKVAQFLKDATTIDRVKLFDANPDVIRAFAGTGIGVAITMPNGDIPKIRSVIDAKAWVDANVVPYYPKTKITYVAIGNEVLHWGPQQAIDNLVRATKYTHQAIVLSGIYDVKVSSPHSLGILLSSEPPSQASFRPGWDVGILAPLLQFCQQSKAPFMINPYPYFGFINLEMALFKPNPGYLDKVTGKLYTSTFDMLMDSVYSSMKKLGYPDIQIMVAETGWPSIGEPWLTHVSIENADAYNSGLIKKVTSGEGTPLMPGRKFETYIFGLFNENQKPGAIAEKNFGLFKPDFSPVYDVGLLRNPGAAGAQPQGQAKPAQGQATGKKWCVAKPDAPDAALQANIDWVCSKGGDCKPTQLGGSCFEPNTVRDHASYIMNSFYQSNGRNDFNCDFKNTGQIVTTDPSKGGCKYAS